MNSKAIYLTLSALWPAVSATAAVSAESDTASAPTTELQEVVVRSRSGLRRLDGATNTHVISVGELRRAACCNLGESFTTNPSVDVSYNDAATGARQIRLLGLSGTYVQMLTENIPAFRGGAMPFGLSYVAGPWMQSIQVSKGASSVKNGHEAVTGQINIEMKKPQTDRSVSGNVYVDHMGKLELNADGNVHLGERWSTALLLHGENAFKAHDSNNDGFADMPRIRQVAAMNRWAYMGSHYVFQAALRYIDERRKSGQIDHGHHTFEHPFTIDLATRRAEAFVKQAFIFDSENDGNVALILSGNMHNLGASYGRRGYILRQRELYASLMFERKWNGLHALSTGINYNYDHLGQRFQLNRDATTPATVYPETENTAGAYLQYTFNLDDRLIAMAGFRLDYSDVAGWMPVPRIHLRYIPAEGLSLHASAGRGFRTPHVMAEYHNLMASSRRFVIADGIKRESAWNTGAGVTYDFRLAGRKVSVETEYYYTRFDNQLVVDMDSDPHEFRFGNLHGQSYSHAFQAQATISPFSDFTATIAYRFTDVKVNYGNGTALKPLTSRNKGLLTMSYAPMMGIWQFDVTCALNGGGRMPDPYRLPDGAMSWRSTYSMYPSLNAQITRSFRHWAVYLGGENLTGYRQPSPIAGASDPWGPDFDATMVYGPLHGPMIYIGVRINFTKY